jgi:hypothetical protein
MTTDRKSPTMKRAPEHSPLLGERGRGEEELVFRIHGLVLHRRFQKGLPV